MKKGALPILSVCLALFLPSFSSGQVPSDQKHQTFFVHFENDVFDGTDRHYTNALKFTWLSKDLTEFDEDTRLPRWGLPLLRKLPLINRPGFQRNLGLSLGQTIFTPEDISRSDLIKDDRPYAGWTYLSLTFHVKNASQMDVFEVTLGIVGPASYAEQTQKAVHRWIESQEPKGWDHQLRNEPGLLVGWHRSWRLWSRGVGRGFGFDFIPRVGAVAGNVLTYASLGGEVRFGYNLPIDFGTSFIRAGSGIEAPADPNDPRLRGRENLGIHLFVDVEGRAVARNIFLDGNTWKESHRVDRKRVVADMAAGLSLLYKHLKLTYAHVYRSKEFDGQDKAQAYGSLTLAITF
ncbi:MAG: lipid A deacylase LpxR family protein [Desulfobacterota bacterium]|nr:lipid A deacylase LpxR family protein [Thermodesulfobacteriota bacterium]